MLLGFATVLDQGIHNDDNHLLKENVHDVLKQLSLEAKFTVLS